jgi:ligand-binding SRPBCC domain-containing protein
MSYSHHFEQWLPNPVEEVFAFFTDPDNLPRLMPVWQKARIEKASIVPAPRAGASASSPAKAAGEGTRLTLSFLPFPLSPFRIRWESEITEFSWKGHFCDRQVRGPFAFWKHCHRLRGVDGGGMDMTLIVDQVEYEMPFGPLGRVAHKVFLRRLIQETFAFRQQEIARIFGQLTPEPRRQYPHSQAS